MDEPERKLVLIFSVNFRLHTLIEITQPGILLNLFLF